MRLNLMGQTFGRLRVISEAGRSKSSHVLWLCRCSCGNQSTVPSDNLRTGHTESCGCLQKEGLAERCPQRVHGHAGRSGDSPTYRSWDGMIQRCTNPNHIGYPRYGGAGVKVCERWMTFEHFLTDMSERPPGTTLSRFGDVGNYEPGNCAWHTWPQQRAEARKKRLAA